MLVPTDAVADHDQEPHDANLRDCARRYCDLTTVDDAIGYLAAGGRMRPALDDVRIVALEQYGAGPVGHGAPGQPRRRRHQDRGPAHGRRRRALRAAVPGGRGLAVLRDLLRRQALGLARPAPPARARGVRGPRARVRRRLLQPARRRPGQAAHHVRRPQAPQAGDRLLLAVGLRHDRAAGGRGRLRLRAAGHGGLDEPDRRPRRPAGEERALAGRPGHGLRGRARADERAVAGAARRHGLRRRRVAVRDRAQPRHVRHHLAPVARLGADPHARTPRTRRWCRSRTSRPPTAGS